MSMQRTCTRETYEALLELGPTEGAQPIAYVLFKRTFAIQGRACVLGPPLPLLHDFRDESLSPRLQPGTDFWPFKEATDVVVRGAAHAPGGRAVDRMMLSASIGRHTKRIAVFGRREIAWTRDGAPRLDPPELFQKIDVTYENAYGGMDSRVRPIEELTAPQFAMTALRIDHPGIYPRNPFGRGYLVERDPVGGVEMPNLEDPADLLTAERLVVGDPGAGICSRFPPVSTGCIP